MIPRPPAVPPNSSESSSVAAERLKKQKAASAALYIGLVLLALWVVRDFIVVVAWAGVVSIALWPLLHKVAGSRWFRGRTTVLATVFTLVIAVLVLLPVALGLAQALREAHELSEWFRGVQENGIAVPDFVNRLPFGVPQITAWWQANLAQPLRDSAAMKGLHSETVMTLGRQFGARALH